MLLSYACGNEMVSVLCPTWTWVQRALSRKLLSTATRGKRHICGQPSLQSPQELIESKPQTMKLRDRVSICRGKKKKCWPPPTPPPHHVTRAPTSPSASPPHWAAWSPDLRAKGGGFCRMAMGQNPNRTPSEHPNPN